MKTRCERKLSLAGLAALVTALAGASNALAAPLDLPRAPLFLNAAVEPNVITTLDDSGSMAWAYMPDVVDDNCGYRHPRFYWYGFNRIYYNPNLTYTPPLRPDGSQFPNASFNAAWFDGYEGQPVSIVPGAVGTPTRDLATQYFPSTEMFARSSNLGNRVAFAPGLADASGVVTFPNCRNPNGNNSTPGTDEQMPVANVDMTIALMNASEVRVTGSAAIGEGANGLGVTNDQINSGETLTINFIAAGGNPAGVQRLQLDFDDPNDTAGGDNITFRIYGADATTLVNTISTTDQEGGASADRAFSERTIGRIDIVGGTNANIGLRRIQRMQEERSAHLPGTSNTFVAMDTSIGSFIAPAFYYRFNGDASNAAQVADPAQYTAVMVSAAEQQNFANWFSYYRNRYLMARSALSRVFGVQDEQLRLGWQSLDQPNNDSSYPSGTPIENRGPGIRWRPGEDDFVRFTGAGRNNFFTWLYRTPASGATPNRAAMLRAANGYRIGGPALSDLRNPYWEGAPLNRELTCRQNFHIHVTDGFTNETTNPSIASGVTARPDTSMTLPDGRSYSTSDPASAVVWDADAPSGTSCGGGACTPQLADIAFAYWATDLRTDLTNNVPTYVPDRSRGVTTTPSGPLPAEPLDDPEVYWNPANDPANWQHMVNFTVGLGVAGTRTYPTDYEALRKAADPDNIHWPGLVNLQPPAIDDLWRAGLVSRGGYFSANNPQELVDSLSATLNSVIVRRGTASAATVTSGIIQSSTLAFRTGFDSGDWSGEVNAFAVDSSGRLIQPPVWAADTVLDTIPSTTRQILTSSTVTGSGIPFQWSSLPAAYQAALNDDPATGVVDNDGHGELRLDYIRGDRSREANNVADTDPGPRFRIRTSVLGAVVNSGAVVVAAPSAGYTDLWPSGAPEADASAELYSTFRNNYKRRGRVIYVGANDGMMHAFDAGRSVDSGGNAVNDPGTGRELFAYVPREVASSLSRLTNQNFEYTPFVDNTPVVRDVFIGNSWRTVLVGSLRRGGQGIFALDITDPTSIDESSAASTVMWEFSDDHPAVAGADVRRLGYTFGRPNIARLPNGKWVVVVPGGYNNDESDAAVGDGSASLFFLDIADGSLIREINIPGARGLATPTMGDYDDDSIDEFAVAGDLDGNLWRFSFTDSALIGNPNPATWTVEKMFNPATPGAQPITSAPRLFPDPGTGGLIAVFGTGKYLEPADRGIAGVPTQSLYGIRDYGPGSPRYPITRATLVQQNLTSTTLLDGSKQFSVTSNGLTADNPDFLLATSGDGWYFNFLDAGERDVTTAGALFSAGLAIVSTIIPNGDDPCLPGLRGNVFLVQGATGSSAQAFATDSNNDGIADSNLSQVGVSVPSTVAEGSPALLAAAGGGIGRLVDFPNITVPQTVWRRRAWREIKPDQ
jgi:type IV pilus assembly protein PilY1